MNSDTILIEEVQNFLLQKYSIEVSIPSLKNLTNSQINLKYCPTSDFVRSQQLSGFEEGHRYEKIIQETEYLLSNANFTMDNIEAFMNKFLQIIDQDIEVMQKNQVIREAGRRTKEKLVVREEDIKNRKNDMVQFSQKIHDKDHLINFVGVDFNKYMIHTKILMQDYQDIRNIEVLTSIKIDNIFDKDIASQQYYMDHYGLLLEVLMRLRNNIINLSDQVRKASYCDMPLKSVNLLANCKNLLHELQQFFIKPQCAFNRLIFYVISLQAQNLELVIRIYNENLYLIKDVFFSVFKSVYLGHIFPVKYQQVAGKIEKYRAKLVHTFLGLRNSQIVAKDQLLVLKKEIEQCKEPISDIRKEIRGIKKVICFEQNKFMRQYIQQKICKKLSLLEQEKEKLIAIEILFADVNKYLQDFECLSKEIVTFPDFESQMNSDIDFLSRDATISDRIREMSQSENEDQPTSESQKQELFSRRFQQIQQKLLKVNGIKKVISFHRSECVEQRLFQIFDEKIEQTDILSYQYSELEIRMFNLYQRILQEKEKKEKEALELIKKSTESSVDYLLSEGPQRGFSSSIGFEIINEDEYCTRIKEELMKINKSFYLSSNYVRGEKLANGEQVPKQQKQKSMKEYQKCLEWALIIFEGSMDDKIFESIVDRMDFKEQREAGVQKNIDKVNQLLTELQKYLKNLMKIKNQIQYRDTTGDSQVTGLTQVLHKLFKVARERLILYQLIENIYYEAVTVYSDLRIKHKKSASLQNSGVKLFDQKTYETVLIHYECQNRIGILAKQIADVKMPLRTKNYLTDQIYDPFKNRLHHYLVYSEADLLDLILRLQSVFKIDSTLKKRAHALQTAINSATSSNRQEKEREIVGAAESMLQLNQQIKQIKDLGREKFVLYDLDKLIKIQDHYKDQMALSQQIFASKGLQNLQAPDNIETEAIRKGIQHIHAIYASG